jgi:hypothetical protein
MAELVTISATLRLTGEDKRSVFIVGNVLPTVSAATAAGFVDAVEKLYNNGHCNANLRINNSDPSLPKAEIEAAIAQMIANNIFDPEKGALESLSKMELTTTERTLIM